ncbi:MAG: hypothetical protein HY062_15970 [Bacteroidetes bacterium]|nr:hypothetical protein [Bacteroidota bacterium]
MKKITLLAAVVVAISFASCRKDRTCECTDTSGGVTYVTTTKVKSTKKDATSWCDAANGSKSTTTANGVTLPNGSTTQTCKIK